jgi:GNAT superfamily N-acetyltransferase
MTELELREEPYDAPVAAALIDAVQQEYVDRYGGPDDAPVQAEEFAPPHGRFLVGYVDAKAVATGGLRRIDATTVEIKRMYVVPDHRGRGHSRAVLAHLEELARSLGATRVVLETGMKQPEAMRLYETSGYSRIEGFGHYCGQELSVSYGKSLPSVTLLSEIG